MLDLNSFLSEHSAEYALVHDVVRLLTPAFPSIVPIYLWMTREGNNAARDSLGNLPLGIVCVYPRRPKVFAPRQQVLHIKINAHVLYTARAYQEVGVPVLAGIPLVADLYQYRIDSPCAWFELIGDDGPHDDVVQSLSLSGNIAGRRELPPSVRGPLGPTEPLNTIREKLRIAPWDVWLDRIRSVRKTDIPYSGTQRPWFAGAYSPFFLLVEEQTHQPT